jgi:hypothetical protein
VNFFNKEIMDTHRATDVGIVLPPSDMELAMVDSHVGQKENVRTVEENV